MDASLPTQDFTATALAPTIGGEISGLDLSQDLTAETVAALRQTWLKHRVLFFRDQNLTPETFKAFARRFGNLEQQPYVRPMAGHPEVIEVIKTPDDSAVRGFGNSWHTDFSFQTCPPMATLLYALECPHNGGDTLFVDLAAVYDSLSDGLKALLGTLEAVHSGADFYGSKPLPSAPDDRDPRELSAMEIYQSPEADGEAVHPVVRSHPETGKKALFVNPGYTIRFAGMSEVESRPLLDFLAERCAQPEYQARFRWRPGSLAFWDNRITQHYALDDYVGERRHMLRLTLQGDRPR